MSHERVDELFQAALSSHLSGRLDDARRGYERTLSINPSHASSVGHLGLIELSTGDVKKAISLIEQSIVLGAPKVDALVNLAYCKNLIGFFDEAIELCRESLAIDNQSDGAWTNLGNAYRMLGKFSDAEFAYRSALGIQPQYPQYLYNLANIYVLVGRYRESVDLLRHSCSIDPSVPETHNALGTSLVRLGDLEEAIRHFSRAIELNGAFAEAFNNRGSAYRDLGRFVEALGDFDRAIYINPSYVQAYSNRGTVFRDLGRLKEAITSHSQAISVGGDSIPEIWGNLGNALIERGERLDGIHAYRQSFSLQERNNKCLGELIIAELMVCDWTYTQLRKNRFASDIENDSIAPPFITLGIFDSLVLQRRAATNYALSTLGIRSNEPFRLHGASRAEQEKIRVGYFSMDFREHPVATLISELIENHDRDKFEIIAFSFGQNTKDLYRKRLEMAFDKFIDLQSKSVIETIEIARGHCLDIALDLGGHTRDARPQIFFERVAPVQINYLGYPGTSGIPNMDYIVADRHLIDSNTTHGYTEAVIYLPDSYQPNDTKKVISGSLMSRGECRLPTEGVVYACFNNNWKITPEVFRSWMKILDNVQKSVLWLYQDNEFSEKNLRIEAKKASIDPDRLVFAKRLPQPIHLARYRLADLFLDTFPYGAHTTASDALWVGTPVLTRRGETFASRVASSLLHTVGLPELVTNTDAEYVQKAIALGKEPLSLSKYRDFLEASVKKSKLYDTAIYTRHLEYAYKQVHLASREGRAPKSFEVAV